MSNLSKKISGFIKKHKLERVQKIVALGLALIVATSVFSYLILPAIATSQDDGIAQISETADTATTMTLNSVDYTVITNGTDGWEVRGTAAEVTIVDDNTVTTYLSVSFTSSQELTNQHFCIAYKGDLTISEDASTGSLYTDGASEPRGAYTIKDGYIYLDIYGEYVSEFKNGISGNITFKATATRTDSTKNDITVTIGSQEVKIEGFRALELSISKTGKFDPTTNTITWTVTVSNPAGKNLLGYTLSDSYFPTDASGITTLPENVGTFTDKTFTFGSITDKEITFTYSCTPTDLELLNGSKITNTATLNDGSKEYSDDCDINVWNDLSLQKAGEVVTNDDGTKSIKWTVTVKNPDGIKNITDLVIKDWLYDTDTSKNITAVNLVSNVSTSISGITINGPTLGTAEWTTEKWLEFTIDSDDSYNGEDIVFTYYTSTDDDVSNYKNSVYTNNKWADASVTTDQVTVTKSGDLNNEYQTSKYVEWTLSVTDPTKSYTGLNGYVIQDDMLKLVDWDKVELGSIGTWRSSSDIKAYCTFNKDKGTITINGLTEEFAVYGITFKYKTAVTDIQKDSTLSENITKDNEGNVVSVTNSATVSDGGGTQIGKDSSTVTVPDPTYYKNGKGVTYVDKNTVTLAWELNIQRQQGDFANTSLVDVMSALNGGNQYITQDQLNSLVIYDNGTNQNLTLDTDYTIEGTKAFDSVENAYTSFTIKFLNTYAVKNLYSVKITYSTTGDISSVDSGVKVQFDNTATYDKEFSDSQYYTKIDTSYTPYTKNFGTESTSEIDGSVTKTKDYLNNSANQQTINGELYYTFTYVVVVENSKYADTQKTYVLTDTLPDGFSYLEDSFECYGDWGNGYQKSQTYTGSSTWEGLCKLEYTDSASPNTIIITKSSNSGYTSSTNDKYIYTIKIKASELEEKLDKDPNYSIVNKIVDLSGHKERTSTVNFTESDIEKTASFTSDSGAELQAGFIRYSVEFNPDSAQYGDGDTVTLTDIMKAGTADGSVACDPDGIIPTLTSLKVYKVDEDGNRTLIDSSNYSYTLDNNPSSTITTARVESATVNNQSGYKISGLTPGVSAKIVLTNPSSTSFDSCLWSLATTAAASNSEDIVADSWTSNSAVSWVDNGNVRTYTIKGSAIKSDTLYFVEYNVSGTSLEACSTGATYAAKLVLTVPDMTHLIIEYEYQSVRRVDNDATDDAVTAINTVTVDSEYKTVTSESDNNYVLKDSSQGTVTGLSGVYNFSKVDIGSNGTALSAGFELYKYDETSGNWIPAVEFTDAVVNYSKIKNAVMPVWGTAATTTTESSTTTTSTTEALTQATTEAAATTFTETPITSIAYYYNVSSTTASTLTWTCQGTNWTDFTAVQSINGAGDYVTTISDINSSTLTKVGVVTDTTEGTGDTTLTVSKIVVNGKYELTVNASLNTTDYYIDSSSGNKVLYANSLAHIWNDAGKADTVYSGDGAYLAGGSSIKLMVATTSTTEAVTTATEASTSTTTTTTQATTASGEASWVTTGIESITYNYTITSGSADTLVWKCQSSSWTEYSATQEIENGETYSTKISDDSIGTFCNLGYFEVADSDNSVTLTVNSVTINDEYKITVGKELSSAENSNGLANIWNAEAGTLYTANEDSQLIMSDDSDSGYIALQIYTTEAATEAATNSTSSTAAELTINKTKKVYLTDSALYMLVEVTTPDDESYSSNKGSKFYFTTSNYAGTIPDGVTNVTTLGSSGSMSLKNAKTITVTAQKDWLGSESSSATFTLYRSHTKSSSIPSDAEVVTIDGVTNPVKVTSSENWIATWENLPNGDVSSGQPWYYYVKETAVNDVTDESEWEYTPYYSGNGLNVTGTVTVYNSKGLTVQKKWYKYDGKINNSPNFTSITFKIYRSTTSGLTASSLSGGDYLTQGELIEALDEGDSSTYAQYIDSDGNVTLNNANNWQISFKNLATTVDNDDSTVYHYYVVEDASQFEDGGTTGQKVEYLNNGNTSSGVITIKNQSTYDSSVTLPATGSFGTVGFIIAGGALAIGALGAIRITRNRKRNDDLIDK